MYTSIVALVISTTLPANWCLMTITSVAEIDLIPSQDMVYYYCSVPRFVEGALGWNSWSMPPVYLDLLSFAEKSIDHPVAGKSRWLTVKLRWQSSICSR